MKSIQETGSIEPMPDLELLGRLMSLRKLFYFIVSVISGAVLLAWLFPLLRTNLPADWWQMQPDTALGILLLVLIKTQTEVKRLASVKRLGRLAGYVVLLFALDAFMRLAGAPYLDLAGLLAVRPGAVPASGMSFQTAVFMTLYSLSLLVEGPGAKARRRTLDLLATLLILSFLTFVGGYIFGATRLFGDVSESIIPPHTLICMALLLFGLVVRRTHEGYYAVLVGLDVGSRVARFVMPFAVFTPFLIMMLAEITTERGWLTRQYASALVSSITATILFTVVMLLARKVNRLERDLVQLTLVDELTHLHNRRGFYALGEHMLFEARRHRKVLTVLFFDLDGLKKVNDSLGHATGSQMIADFAELLQDTFRSNDVVARLGGDEFGVAVLESDPRTPMKRLGVATAEFNREGTRPYRISYSVGDVATPAPPGPESFTDLVAKADAVMYERKRRKKELKAAEASA